MRRYKLLKLFAGLDWNMAEMDKDCSRKKKPNKKKEKGDDHQQILYTRSLTL